MMYTRHTKYIEESRNFSTCTQKMLLLKWSYLHDKYGLIVVLALYVLSGGPVGSMSRIVKISFLNFIPAEEGLRIKDAVLGAGTGLTFSEDSSVVCKEFVFWLGSYTLLVAVEYLPAISECGTTATSFPLKLRLRLTFNVMEAGSSL